MCDRRLELLAPERPQRSDRDCERRARRAATDGEEPRKAVVDEVELGRAHAELGRDLVGARAKHGILRQRERTRAEHSEKRAVAVAVDAGRGEQRAEREEERRRQAADQPAERRRTRPRARRRAPVPSGG